MSISTYTRAEHLTKEQELETGRIIQENLKFYLELNELERSGKTSEAAQYAKDHHNELTKFKNAEARLMNANIGLVENEVNKFIQKVGDSASHDRNDMEQCGMTGLIIAIRKYDPTRGFKFSTMAIPWIFTEISRSFNNYGKSIRLPENRLANYRAIKNMMADMEDSDFSQAEKEEIIMRELNLSREDITVILAAIRPTVSIDGLAREGEDDNKDIMDIVSFQMSHDETADVVERAEMKKAVANIFSSLSKKEIKCIGARYGFADSRGGKLTKRKVSNRLRIPLEDVDTIADSALVKLRNKIVMNGITADDVI